MAQIRHACQYMSILYGHTIFGPINRTEIFDGNSENYNLSIGDETSKFEVMMFIFRATFGEKMRYAIGHHAHSNWSGQGPLD